MRRSWITLTFATCLLLINGFANENPLNELVVNEPVVSESPVDELVVNEPIASESPVDELAANYGEYDESAETTCPTHTCHAECKHECHVNKPPEPACPTHTCHPGCKHECHARNQGEYYPEGITPQEKKCPKHTCHAECKHECHVNKPPEPACPKHTCHAECKHSCHARNQGEYYGEATTQQEKPCPKHTCHAECKHECHVNKPPEPKCPKHTCHAECKHPCHVHNQGEYYPEGNTTQEIKCPKHTCHAECKHECHVNKPPEPSCPKHKCHAECKNPCHVHNQGEYYPEEFAPHAEKCPEHKCHAECEHPCHENKCPEPEYVEYRCPEKEYCGKNPYPARLGVRHIEANGVGYKHGYTTGELFYTPRVRCKLPFADLRAHYFNNGKWATNVGVGYRQLICNRIYGGNVYWDYRKTRERHFNQIGLGFETIGRCWDFRINGYLPFGKRESHAFHRDHEDHCHPQGKARREFIFSSANAEAGYHFPRVCHFTFYTAAGPYYLHSKREAAWGGKLRLLGKYKEYASLELSTSYDRIFKNIYQAEFALTLPLGTCRRPIMRSVDSRLCCDDLCVLRKRLIQKVDRNEIIPLNTHHAH